MNQAEQNLLSAIQKTLWNTECVFPPDTDWNAVLDEAEKQAVLGIAVNAAPKEIQDKWKSKTSYDVMHFIRILHYQSAMCELLQTNGIPMAILKGTAAALYYPDPIQRTMGDIDFIVSKESFDQAKGLLASNGYHINEEPLYPRHIEVEKDGISFEMHRFFTDNDGVDVDRFLFEGLKKTETGKIYNSAFPMFPAMENGLVLLAHVAHHLRAGLGLRQMIDWMMFADRELDDELWQSAFEAAAQETGLDTLAKTATRMCQKYLGLSDRITWCNDADPELCDLLLENLLSSGNFGRKRGSGLKIESAVSHLRRKGFRHLQKAGENNWQAYHKHRWLKPFAWIYQIGRYSRQGLQMKRQGEQIKEDVERGKQRGEIIQKLKIGKIKK